MRVIRHELLEYTTAYYGMMFAIYIMHRICMNFDTKARKMTIAAFDKSVAVNSSHMQRLALPEQRLG